MTPETVAFTGLELNPREMMWSRVVPGPYPADWQRIVIKTPDFNTRPLTEWLLENVNGRFGIIVAYPQVALFFEDMHDAILFKLKDGNDAWMDTSF
jgi:hypothetical protein